MPEPAPSAAPPWAAPPSAAPPSAAPLLPRRRLLAVATLLGAGSLLGASALPRPEVQAGAGYRPTFARLAYSGDPSAAGTDRWAWQALQGDVRRPAAGSVPAQYLYATAARRTTDPDGVTQCLRPADVPSSWLLRERSGAVITRQGEDAAIDVGVPAFRAAAAASLLARCRTGGWSGVLLDEVNGSFAYGWPGAVPERYPTDESWQQALLGFVTELAATLRGGGFDVVGNLAQFLPEHESWNLQLVTAGLQPSCEVFLHGYEPGSAPATGQEWRYGVRCVEWATQNAPRVVVLERQTDPARIRYSLCSVLLVDNGRVVFGSDVDHASTTSLYPPVYALAVALGAPTAAATEPVAGLFLRTFTHGRVVVNSRDTPITMAGTVHDAATGAIERA